MLTGDSGIRLRLRKESKRHGLNFLPLLPVSEVDIFATRRHRVNFLASHIH